MARVILAACFVILLLFSCSPASDIYAQTLSSTKHSQNIIRPVVVTPVGGLSTLNRLGLSIERTTMGWAGQWRPEPKDVAVAKSTSARKNDVFGPFVLNGSDIYRLSCRPCHTPDGSGAPTEINSIIGPVQSASAAWMTNRMKERGRPIDPKFIKELTSGTEEDIRNRLRSGGHNMPSFAYLSEREIKVLRPYLDALAGIPNSKNGLEISEPAVRVGELIVKGTCHICHDAIGQDNKPVTALSAVIPSLAVISHQKLLNQFVQKVIEGAPIPMGIAGMTSRGRMPVFNYLSGSEASAAYIYLMAYPPQ